MSREVSIGGKRERKKSRVCVLQITLYRTDSAHVEHTEKCKLVSALVAEQTTARTDRGAGK